MAEAVEQGMPTLAYSGELPNYLYKSWFDFQIAGRNHIIENETMYGVNRFITRKNQELIDAWYRDLAYLYDSRIIESDEQEDLLKTVERAIMQYGIKVVLIDNLMTAMYIDAGPEQQDKYDRQGRFVRELTKIAIRYDVLIILVAHQRKNTFTNDANDEVSGSGDITNLAGITLSYNRGTTDDYDKGIMNPEQRRLIVAKNRLFGKTNTNGFVLSYDEKSKRVYGSGDDVNRQYGWDNSGGFDEVNNMEIPF